MKTVLIFFLFTFYTFNLFSQQNSSEKHFLIKPNYGLANIEPKDPSLVGVGIPVNIDFKFPVIPCFGFDLNYKFNTFSEAGIYFNYSKLSRVGIYQFMNSNGEESWTYNLLPTKTLYYGLNYLYHFPISVLKNSRLDIYTILRTGIVSEKYYKYQEVESDENYSSGSLTELWDKPEFEIGLGAGVNYYLLKNLGVFAEAQGGKFHNNQLFKWRTGIVIKL